MADPRDARIASLVEQRDTAWAALRENNPALALATANGTIAAQEQQAALDLDTITRLTDQITALNATNADLAAQLAACLGS